MQAAGGYLRAAGAKKEWGSLEEPAAVLRLSQKSDNSSHKPVLLAASLPKPRLVAFVLVAAAGSLAG